ncbi:5'-nucleotidase C-terminal domain-containing protein [Parendozoicomonas sp. Alg238-R29]|uniref:5'-nucleotidase C-terminal domain-containing protein n=1 Tax=Parendozoicomonas sp. Alg238-R29 TaxID=2993446 RepID=UPI00248EE017|nr:5'-nucleotidase C-terminal domain-containing protein [Parendozoicomonas sp. Alg238-R29]
MSALEGKAGVNKVAVHSFDMFHEKDSNILGSADVFLEGHREAVRTEETSVGNLTADANLAAAQQYDSSVMVSIKNGDGIRAQIGTIQDDGAGNYSELPSLVNPASGKQAGQVSQLDIENTLKFNHSLTLLTLTAEQLVQVLEHGVAASGWGSLLRSAVYISVMTRRWHLVPVFARPLL